MKKIKFLILVSIFSINGFAQSILNGDFEDNLSLSCEFNLQNSQYSYKMSNSWGFGSANELDIQTNLCGYANTISKNWFVSLSKHQSGEYDELSLKLSSNLIMGNVYKISYFEYAADTFGNYNIPLQLGLSNDSLTFGHVIYNSLPIYNTWTYRNFTFIAPNNGKYITVRIDSAGTLKGWNFIDNIQFEQINEINEILDYQTVNIFPNPTNESFVILSTTNINQIKIYDSTGRILFTKEVDNLSYSNFEHLNNGIYFIKIITGNKYIIKKIVIDN